MQLLVTTSKSFLAIDTETSEEKIIHTGKGLYFGIALADDFIFVGARNSEDCFDYLGKQSAEKGEILVFDYQLQLQKIIQAPFALRDIHQILWFDNKLWVTCSRDNLVALYDLHGWGKWYPAEELSARGEDINHFNSLFYDGRELHILAHNFGASEIWSFSYPGLEIIAKLQIGNQAHNIWTHGDRDFFICDSLNGAVASVQGECVEIGGFPRGVVATADKTYIGTSDIAERSERSAVSSKIIVFDMNWQRLTEFRITGQGQLLDMRMPGVRDYCLPFRGSPITNKSSLL